MTMNTQALATKPRGIGVDEEVMEGGLLPKLVEEEIGLVEEQLPVRGSRDEFREGRILQLKFLDQVSGPVQTGKMLRGTNGECLKLALVDSGEQIVNCGPAEAEIVLLHDGNGQITRENFKRRIIRTGEKKRPHFVKRVFVDLKEGVADLAGVQLGQDSGWTKICDCRLGATLVQSPVGVAARDAWTPPFKVGDKRKNRNEKHEPPLLSSQVWRLRRIGRNGEPSKRLDKRNIETVQDFLFWFHVKPKELKQILGFGDVLWKTVVTHAKDCTIDDRRMYSHGRSNEPRRRIVYDAVGRLKGVIKESHFVAVENLSADEKENAGELLVSVLEGPAFGERYGCPFSIEASWIGSCLTSSGNVDHPPIIPDPANVPFLDCTDHRPLMAGESRNASFCNLVGYLCGDDDDEFWGTNDWLSNGPPSPNSMDYFAANDTIADEPPPPPPQPQPQDVSTSRWKSSFSKLLVSLREKMSLDFIRSHKKRKIG